MNAVVEPHQSPSTTSPSIDCAISADFPYESRFVEVHGAQMHYVEAGEGAPILFIHGNPTSAYLWRNVMPELKGQGRCIAVDLIGMGKSDRPAIAYSYDDQSRYLAGFIEALGIGKGLTLVLHDWGSMLGFRWASEHPDKVRAVAFMEAMVRPLSYADLPGSLKIGMRVMRNPFFNWLLVGVGNMFVKKMLPDLTYRRMSPEVRAHYQADYPTIASRRAVRAFPQQVPFDGRPSRSYEIVTDYIEWIRNTKVPMLLLYGDDGIAIKAPEVAWLRETVSQLDVVDLGHGKHFLQETHPAKIGREISNWLETRNRDMKELIVTTQVDIDTSASEAWRVFGEGFADWADWAPGIDESRMEGPLAEGSIRVNTAESLGTVRQALLRFAPEERSLAYEMREGLPPFFESVRNDWQIFDSGMNASRLEGRAAFVLKDEALAMRDKLEGKMGVVLEVFAQAFRERFA